MAPAQAPARQAVNSLKSGHRAFGPRAATITAIAAKHHPNFDTPAPTWRVAQGDSRGGMNPPGEDGTLNTDHELLERNDSLLLLVDLQKSMLANCVAADRIRENAALLIQFARVLQIPAIFTEQNPGRLGPFLPELTTGVPDPAVFEKIEFGCFENEPIRRAVADSGRRSILLAGIEAHVCIFQTGIRALALGYRVHAVADAISASSRMHLDIGLGRLEQGGAVITSMEMAVFELLRQADTVEFRAALPYIKKIAR